jgi:hypothetical protein
MSTLPVGRRVRRLIARIEEVSASKPVQDPVHGGQSSLTPLGQDFPSVSAAPSEEGGGTTHSNRQHAKSALRTDPRDRALLIFSSSTDLSDPSDGTREAGAKPRPRALDLPWTDDRGWIIAWRDAGPTLAEREPVLLAWLAAAPQPPLPRRLAAVELRRIAAQHGITVEMLAP